METPRQSRSPLLGLDHAHGLPVDEQHVVGRTGARYQLAYGDSHAGVEVDRPVILHHPARSPQHRIDALPGPLFGVEV